MIIPYTTYQARSVTTLPINEGSMMISRMLHTPHSIYSRKSPKEFTLIDHSFLKELKKELPFLKGPHLSGGALREVIQRSFNERPWTGPFPKDRDYLFQSRHSNQSPTQAEELLAVIYQKALECLGRSLCPPVSPEAAKQFMTARKFVINENEPSFLLLKLSDGLELKVILGHKTHYVFYNEACSTDLSHPKLPLHYPIDNPELVLFSIKNQILLAPSLGDPFAKKYLDAFLRTGLYLAKGWISFEHYKHNAYTEAFRKELDTNPEQILKRVLSMAENHFFSFEGKLCYLLHIIEMAQDERTHLAFTQLTGLPAKLLPTCQFLLCGTLSHSLARQMNSSHERFEALKKAYPWLPGFSSQKEEFPALIWPQPYGNLAVPHPKDPLQLLEQWLTSRPSSEELFSIQTLLFRDQNHHSGAADFLEFMKRRKESCPEDQKEEAFKSYQTAVVKAIEHDLLLSDLLDIHVEEAQLLEENRDLFPHWSQIGKHPYSPLSTKVRTLFRKMALQDEFSPEDKGALECFKTLTHTALTNEELDEFIKIAEKFIKIKGASRTIVQLISEKEDQPTQIANLIIGLNLCRPKMLKLVARAYEQSSNREDKWTYFQYLEQHNWKQDKIEEMLYRIAISFLPACPQLTPHVARCIAKRKLSTSPTQVIQEGFGKLILNDSLPLEKRKQLAIQWLEHIDGGLKPGFNQILTFVFTHLEKSDCIKVIPELLKVKNQLKKSILKLALPFCSDDQKRQLYRS